MDRESLIKDIISHLLTHVDARLLSFMSGAEKEASPFGSGTILGLVGGQDLNDPNSSLYVHLRDSDRGKYKQFFASRYRRMILEFMELKEGLLSHQMISDSDFKAEIIKYITDSDRSLGNSIYKVAANQAITSAISSHRRASADSAFEKSIRSLGEQSINLAMAGLKENISITSQNCNQHFDSVETSTKGMVKLIGGGKDFVFHGHYIEEVIPCFRAEPKDDFSFIYESIRALAGQGEVKKRIYTAIRMSGKYQGLIFVQSDFDYAYKKINDAMRISKSIQRKQLGDFS